MILTTLRELGWLSVSCATTQWLVVLAFVAFVVPPAASIYRLLLIARYEEAKIKYAEWHVGHGYHMHRMQHFTNADRQADATAMVPLITHKSKTNANANINATAAAGTVSPPGSAPPSPLMGMARLAARNGAGAVNGGGDEAAAATSGAVITVGTGAGAGTGAGVGNGTGAVGAGGAHDGIEEAQGRLALLPPSEAEMVKQHTTKRLYLYMALMIASALIPVPFITQFDHSVDYTHVGTCKYNGNGNEH
jgi:hypothetical protein